MPNKTHSKEETANGKRDGNKATLTKEKTMNIIIKLAEKERNYIAELLSNRAGEVEKTITDLQPELSSDKEDVRKAHYELIRNLNRELAAIEELLSNPFSSI